MCYIDMFQHLPDDFETITDYSRGMYKAAMHLVRS